VSDLEWLRSLPPGGVECARVKHSARCRCVLGERLVWDSDGTGRVVESSFVPCQECLALGPSRYVPLIDCVL
jgi:hypothetical protein